MSRSCSSCKETIGPDEQTYQYGGKDYHTQCIYFPPPVLTPKGVWPKRTGLRRELPNVPSGS